MRSFNRVFAIVVVGLALGLPVVGCGPGATKSKDKMESGTMETKMPGDKMQGDKMKSDNMQGDKMKGEKSNP